MKALLWVLFLSGIVIASKAQRTCGAAEYAMYLQQLQKTNPSLQIASRPASNLAGDTSALQIINIPVVIHLLYNTPAQNISDAQILSQFDVLNKDYRRQNADTVNTPNPFKSLGADARISFCLAQVDPNGRRTTGIIRKATNQGLFIPNDAMKFSAQGGDDAWDCTKYLNIWVCNLVSSSLGYTTPPGGEADRDGVVIGYNVFGNVGTLRAPFDKGRTATHEIGHWLGLRHTWGDADCGNDSIADTPQQESYNFGCPAFPHLSTCSPNANGDMFMDFMDFSDDGCMNIFTVDQVKKMRSLFAANNSRNSFLISYQCDSMLAQAGPLPTSPSEGDVVTATVIKIYPNPVHSQLIIQSDSISTVKQKTLHIYNTLGVQVLEVQLSQATTTLNISSFVNGIYIVRIIGDNKDIFTTKIIRD
jgi:hypothetical protein